MVLSLRQTGSEVVTRTSNALLNQSEIVRFRRLMTLDIDPKLGRSWTRHHEEKSLLF